MVSNELKEQRKKGKTMNDTTTVIKTINGKRSGYTTNDKVHIDREFAKNANLTRIEVAMYDSETQTTTELVFDRSQFNV